MATIIKAGNVASGAQITPDATGILQLNTGSGAGTEAMRIDTSGYILGGYSSAFDMSPAGTGQYAQISASSASANWKFGALSFSTDNTANGLLFIKSRSATVGTNTVVQSGDALGNIGWRGGDGTNYINAAAIQAAVDGTPGTNDMPGRLVFFTTADGSSSTTERMRIDSSGNVGIGTTSPTQKLHVASAASAGNVYSLIDSSGTANGYNAANLYKNDQRQFRVGVLGTVGGFTNGALVVYDETAAAYRMVIDSGGNVLINATTRASLEKVNITHDGASQEGLIIVNTNTAAGTHTAIGFRRPSATTVGTITTTLSATAFNTSSDYRLKENVKPMIGALAKVSALKPCTYKWKVDGSDGEGFIAHELAEVCPSAVTGEKDAVDDEGNIKPQGIDTSFLVATLTAAIQEQQAMIEELKAKVVALEGAA